MALTQEEKEIEKFKEEKEKQKFKNVVEEINYINKELLSVDGMGWGNLTPEDADDIYKDLYDGSPRFTSDDWSGNKSKNILEFVKGNGGVCGETSHYFNLTYSRTKIGL